MSAWCRSVVQQIQVRGHDLKSIVAVLQITFGFMGLLIFVNPTNVP